MSKEWPMFMLASTMLISFPGGWEREEKGAPPIHQSEGNKMLKNIEEDSLSGATVATVKRFNEAFNRHDVDAVMGLMTDDCVFDNTRPSPDGTRYEGARAVRACWEDLFKRSPQASFTTEEMIGAGDRCVVRWVYHWVKEGKPGHVRGVDVFRVREGKVAEKLSYVKG